MSRQSHRFGDEQPNTDAAFAISRNPPALVVVQTLGAIIGPVVATPPICPRLLHQFGADSKADAGSLPAENRLGLGRYPFRVRM